MEYQIIKFCGNFCGVNVLIFGQEEEKMGIVFVDEIFRVSYNGDKNMNELEGG